jgi:DNA-binding XRE family transcriptional regulator
MSLESESHNSWLYQAWVSAGFKTRSALAQRLGVSKDIVYLWELGKHRPPWSLVFKIARAAKRPTREAAEALWNENKGDPCPCGRGGEKILVDEALELLANGALLVEGTPAQLQNARMMPIKHVCANPKCGQIRIFLHRRTRGHPELCQSCCHLAEKTPFWCDGKRLPNFDIPQHAKHCETARGPILLTPTQIRKRERSAMLSSNPDKFFDRSSGRYICHRCLKAVIALGNRLKRVRELEAEEAGHQKISMVKIRTRERLDEGYRKHRNNQGFYRKDDAEGPEISARGLYRLLDRVPEEAQKKGRQTYTEICKTNPDKQWLQMTEGCMLRRWGRRCAQPECRNSRRIKGQQSRHAPHPGVPCTKKDCSCTEYLPTKLPTDVRFGICVLCLNRHDPGFIIVRKNSANIQLRFHNCCWQQWRKNDDSGRRYIWRKRQGEAPSLPSYESGDRLKEEDLRIRWSWIWQHFAGGRSYEEIGREQGFSRSWIKEQVDYMIDHLPDSSKVDNRYGPEVELAKGYRPRKDDLLRVEFAKH